VVFFEPEKLTFGIQSILLNDSNNIYYSPVNLWEISIKYNLKKLTLNGMSPEEFFDELDTSFYLCKDIRGIDVITSYKLPLHHKDPFDRYLIWDAIQNDMVLISADKALTQYIGDGLKLVYI
jgi:PIN domain nuclease of toxin-antitoxin system